MGIGTKSGKIVRMFAIFFSLLAFVACSDENETNKNSQKLVANFYSNQAVALFEKDHPSFRKLLSENVKSDKITLIQYQDDEYKLLNNSVGVMLITFFNDRLMSVLFYPNDCSDYETVISSFESRDVDGNVELIHGVDYQDACYILWADKNLQSEFDYSVR